MAYTLILMLRQPFSSAPPSLIKLEQMCSRVNHMSLLYWKLVIPLLQKLSFGRIRGQQPAWPVAHIMIPPVSRYLIRFLSFPRCLCTFNSQFIMRLCVSRRIQRLQRSPKHAILSSYFIINSLIMTRTQRFALSEISVYPPRSHTPNLSLCTNCLRSCPSCLFFSCRMIFSPQQFSPVTFLVLASCLNNCHQPFNNTSP